MQLRPNLKVSRKESKSKHFLHWEGLQSVEHKKQTFIKNKPFERPSLKIFSKKCQKRPEHPESHVPPSWQATSSRETTKTKKMLLR